MEKILVISRILSEYRNIFKEEDIDVTLNEALVLEAVKNTQGTKASISRALLKDKAYVYRLINVLMEKDLVEREGKVYRLTEGGRRVYEQSSEICRVVGRELADEKDNYSQCLIKKARTTMTSMVV